MPGSRSAAPARCAATPQQRRGKTRASSDVPVVDSARFDLLRSSPRLTFVSTELGADDDRTSPAYDDARAARRLNHTPFGWRCRRGEQVDGGAIGDEMRLRCEA